MPTGDAVGLEESVPLVAALACRLADEIGVRTLLIKGFPATDLGVRSPRASIDADVWVDPSAFDRYLDRLTAAGWVPYAPVPEAVGWGHAVTMTHAAWPSTVDVHRRFPGFLTDDATAFAVAWHTRGRARIAHQEVAVPSRPVAAAITVLHSVRSPTISGADDDRAFALAAARCFTPADRAELALLAATTGSAEPLDDLLTAAGCDVPPGPAPDAERLQEWRTRLAIGVAPVTPWLLALRAASWPLRLHLLVLALRPRAKDYAESGADHDARGFAQAALYRWRRGVRALPGGVRLLREAAGPRPR